MNKENILKLALFAGFVVLFLFGSRFPSETKKVACIEGKCTKPHQHGQLNYHERFEVTGSDNTIVAILKSSANFWEANATGMTFAIIIGAAGLSLTLSYKKFATLLQFKGVKGAALGSLIGMPLNMCANCSAITSVSLTAQNGGSAETTLGILLGSALLNFTGIVAMVGLFSPAVIIARIAGSILMIVVVVPFVSKFAAAGQQRNQPLPAAFSQISCFLPDLSLGGTLLKSFEDWLIAAGNIAIKLIPLMLLGTLLTGTVRVIFPNELLHHLTAGNSIITIMIVAFISTLLSIPVLFEILLGVLLLNLGFSNGAVAAMVFAAPSFGLFTLVLTRAQLGGLKVPILLLSTTFLMAIAAGLLAEWLTIYFLK